MRTFLRGLLDQGLWTAISANFSEVVYDYAWREGVMFTLGKIQGYVRELRDDDDSPMLADLADMLEEFRAEVLDE